MHWQTGASSERNPCDITSTEYSMLIGWLSLAAWPGSQLNSCVVLDGMRHMLHYATHSTVHCLAKANKAKATRPLCICQIPKDGNPTHATYQAARMPDGVGRLHRLALVCVRYGWSHLHSTLSSTGEQSRCSLLPLPVARTSRLSSAAGKEWTVCKVKGSMGSMC